MVWSDFFSSIPLQPAKDLSILEESRYAITARLDVLPITALDIPAEFIAGVSKISMDEVQGT